MNRQSDSGGKSLLAIFAWPMALAVLTLVGLIATLWGGTVWSPVSWGALAIPPIVIGRYLLVRRGPDRR
ncbi:MAG: hypothetical protein R3C52_10620 [Hyphomonadaceae bacterium]